MTPQNKLDARPLEQFCAAAIFSPLNAWAKAMEPVADAPLKLGASIGLPDMPETQHSIQCRAPAVASLNAAEGLMKFHPLNLWQQSAQAMIDVSAEMTPEPMKCVMSPIWDRARANSSFFDFDGALETISDLRGVVDKLPETITFSGLVAKGSQGKDGLPKSKAPMSLAERMALDVPSNVDVLLSINPWTNLRGVTAMGHVLFGDHKHLDDFNIPSVELHGEDVPVTMSIIGGTKLSHHKLFTTDQTDPNKPLVVLAAPMSGHPASFTQPMVEHILKSGSNVLITEDIGPENYAKDVKRGLSEHVMEYVRINEVAEELSGGHYHVIAICEPGASVLAAAAYMRQTDGNEDRTPLSITLINSPIVPGAASNDIVDFIKDKSPEWLQKLKCRLPNGQEVQSSQIDGFYASKIGRHMQGIANIHGAAVRGDYDAEAKGIATYQAFNQDRHLPWELYQDLIMMQFQNSLLGKGQLEVNGVVIDPSLLGGDGGITLHTIGAEYDDITAPPQCEAAQALTPDITKNNRAFHHIIPGTGHYGPWGYGSAARDNAIPLIMSIIHESSQHAGYNPGQFMVNGTYAEPVKAAPYTLENLSNMQQLLETNLFGDNLPEQNNNANFALVA